MTQQTEQQLPHWIAFVDIGGLVKTFDIFGDEDTAEYHARRIATALQTVNWWMRPSDVQEVA